MKYSYLILIFPIAYCLAGCPSKTNRASSVFSALVSNAKSLKNGDIVYFKGMEAGRVVSVSPFHDKLRVNMKLDYEFKNRIHEGAKARVLYGGAASGITTSLWIVGGTDIRRPLLSSRTVLQEYEISAATERLCHAVLQMTGEIDVPMEFGKFIHILVQTGELMLHIDDNEFHLTQNWKITKGELLDFLLTNGLQGATDILNSYKNKKLKVETVR